MDINEVARRAGVSRATVSRYLNDGYVSKEKRELIARIIKETGYVPSRRAQQLRTGKTKLVGVVIPKINSQSVSRMVAGITNTLSEYGYQVVLANTENDTEQEVKYLDLFNRRNHVDGVILIATVLKPEHKRLIGELRIPFVVLGQRLEEGPCVYQDDYHAARDLTKLVLQNAKAPAYLGVLEQDVAAGRERHRGFLDACAAAGIDVDEEAQLVVGFEADDGFFGAERLLGAVPNLDTIVCATDEIAFGAMMCMREFGKGVPEEVQVAGMGDSLLSRIIYPSLTTVHLSFKTGGAEAARMLLSQMGELRCNRREVCLDYEVYARNSIR